MSVALVRTLNQVANNPKTRQMALQVAKQMGTRTIQAIQRRRQRKGRRVMLPGIFGIRPPKPRQSRKTPSVFSSAVSQPVRISTTNVKRTGPQLCFDEELTTLVIPVNTTGTAAPGGGSVVVPLSVDQSNLWPKLYQQSLSFSRYSCMRLQVVYTANAGTQNDGKVYLAFTKNQIVTGDFATPQDFTSLPCSIDGSLSKDVTLDISPSDFNQNGKDLIIDSTQMGNTYASSSLYYLGNLVINSFNATSGVLPGMVKLRYRMMLTQTQMSIASTNSLASWATGDTQFSVERKGEACFTEIESTDPGIEYFMPRRHYVFVVHTAASHPSLEIDGAGDTFTYIDTYVGSTQAIDVLEVPAGGRRVLTYNAPGEGTPTTFLRVWVTRRSVEDDLFE